MCKKNIMYVRHVKWLIEKQNARLKKTNSENKKQNINLNQIFYILFYKAFIFIITIFWG